LGLRLVSGIEGKALGPTLLGNFPWVFQEINWEVFGLRKFFSPFFLTGLDWGLKGLPNFWERRPKEAWLLQVGSRETFFPF